MYTTEEITPNMVKKCLAALEKWCQHYIDGTVTATPRYSQISRDWNEEDCVIKLRGTVRNIAYNIPWTSHENNIITNIDSNERWEWWREIRTEYLIENYGDKISAY